MDILIKNIKMPKSCEECIFNQFHEANPWTTWETCMILEKNTDDIGEDRLADCPLVEVEQAKTGVVYPTESKMWVEAST